ncbi:MAG: GAF domain-containing protein, partial [Candidatus Zixiibacteriota bacterium]
MNTVLTFILPLVVLAAGTFLILRMRFFTDRIGGRYAFLFGGLLSFFAAVWQLVKIHPDYDDWFIITAYPVIDFVQYGLLLIGLLLVGIGLALYSDFWQTRLEDMKIREGKLSILDNLQNDARQPYQLVELLNLSLKEIIFHLQGCAGAIFLINRHRRQFVLTSAAGLTREETAHLEYYPLQGNIVSQAVELGDPLLTGEFNFIGRDGEAVKSRFKSGMILPLISGIEKVGGILLFAEETKYFSNADIKFLSPISDWLSEKIKTARLSRELSISKNEIEKLTSQQTDFVARVRTVAASFGSSDGITVFCRSLVGLAESESVHLVGIRNGILSFYGGSEPLLDLSENYKTALINAVGRKKPLIINQESADESGRSRTVLSNLVCPLDDGDAHDALLFRKEASPFRVDDYILKVIGVFSRLARLILNQSSLDRLAITRRLGLDKILELLKFEEDGGDFEKEAGFFLRQLADILPPESQAVMFVRDERGAFKAVDGLKVKLEDLKNFYIQPGEGGVGRLVVDSTGQFLYGKARVGQNLDTYDVVNRNAFNRLSGDRGLPVFTAHCPVQRLDTVIGVAVVMIYDMNESEKGEWERLLTLAAGLYSLRLTMLGLQQDQLRRELSDYESGRLGILVNQLNNHLSAVLGNAELLSRREDISGATKQQLQGIMAEAEKAARLVKKSLAEVPRHQLEEIKGTPEEPDRLNDIVEKTLAKFHISGNL